LAATFFLVVVALPALFEVFFTVAFFAVVDFVAGFRSTTLIPDLLPDESPEVLLVDVVELELLRDADAPPTRIVCGFAVASGDPSEVLPVDGNFLTLPPGRLVIESLSV